jgi:hypothetical protein
MFKIGLVGRENWIRFSHESLETPPNGVVPP